ncbi:glycoside hydrolase family protein [Hydrogenimonas sp.]
MDIYSELVEEIKRDEGFRGMPYQDTKGIWTIGFGNKLPLDRAEAELITEKRINAATVELKEKLYFFDDLPDEAKKILINMAYNLGVNGLMKFKRMLDALEFEDYDEAANEMVDSVWYREVGKRAKRLVKRMRSLA